MGPPNPFQLNNLAQTGFQNASEYDAHRPSYPAEAVGKLLTHLNLKDVKNARVIDLACGTGKFTELLVRRPEGYEILGVEPHEGMRRELEGKNWAREVGGKLKVTDGDAGNMPVEEGWADGVVAAQAFHWFATEDSLKEINRVLRPGAAFGMIWNVEDYNAPKSWPSTTKWEQTLKAIIATLDDGHPRFRNMVWKNVFDAQQDTTPFQTVKDQLTGNLPNFSLPLGEEGVEWTVWLDDEAIWKRYSTLSQIANLDAERKESVRKEVLGALEQEGVERNEKGEVELHGRTHLAWTSRV